MRNLLILLAASTALAACATPADRQPPSAVAAAERPEIGTYGFDTAGMDPTVDPGDNFYDHANGTWARTTPIPPDRSNYGMFTMLEELSNQRTRAILEEQANVPGSKIGDFYASFMD